MGEMNNQFITKMMNIDCFEGMALMESGSVTHVFTSPPYNRKRNDKYSHYDDTITDYKTFLRRTIDESLRLATDYVFFNIQKNYYNKKEVFDIIGEYSKEMIDIIIWNKFNPMPARGFNITNAYEFIFVLSKNKTSLKSNRTYTKNTFMTNAFTNNEYTKIHKAVMHPEACNYVIENFTKEGDVVLDMFMGVGTTALTCIENKRKFIGFEISEEYFNIALNRVEKTFGIKSEKVGGNFVYGRI